MRRGRPTETSDASTRFEALFREHAEVVLAYAMRRIDPEAAKDVVAETFTIAWRRFVDVPAAARPWLLAVARRVLANQHRSSNRARALTLQLVQEWGPATADPAGELDTALSALPALAQLPPSEREALQLLAWEGLTPSEAASVLGCSRGAFAVRVHRARRKMRRHLRASDTSAGMKPEGIATGAEDPSSDLREVR